MGYWNIWFRKHSLCLSAVKLIFYANFKRCEWKRFRSSGVFVFNFFGKTLKWAFNAFCVEMLADKMVIWGAGLDNYIQAIFKKASSARNNWEKFIISHHLKIFPHKFIPLHFLQIEEYKWKMIENWKSSFEEMFFGKKKTLK